MSAKKAKPTLRLRRIEQWEVVETRVLEVRLFTYLRALRQS